MEHTGQRTVSQQEAEHYAASMNVQWFETSAKDNTNVDRIFTDLVEQFVGNLSNRNTGTSKSGSGSGSTDSRMDSVDLEFVVFGAYQTGKHALTEQWVEYHGPSRPEQSVYHKQISSKEGESLNITVKVMDIDHILTDNAVLDTADGLIAVCDVTQKRSFDRVASVVDALRKLDCYHYTKPIVVAAHKSDTDKSQRVMDPMDIATFVSGLGVNGFMETSILNQYDDNGMESGNMSGNGTMNGINRLFNSVIASIRGYCDMESGEKIKDLQQHSAAAWCMALSVDHRFLYSGSHDGTVRVWDIESGTLLAIYANSTRQIFKVFYLRFCNFVVCVLGIFGSVFGGKFKRF